MKDHLGDAAQAFQEVTHPGKFDITKEFKNAFEVIKLKATKMHTVSESKNASLGAFLFILITIIATNFGNYLVYFRFGLARAAYSNLIVTALITLASLIISIFVYDFIGSYIFKGKKSFRQLFRVMGYGYLIMIVSLVPVLTLVGSIWYLIITYKSLINVKKLDPTNAVITMLLTIVAVALIFFVISLIIGGDSLYYYGFNSYGLPL